MAFHDRLKQARKNAGITQEDIAKILGIAKSTYSGYETGKSEPSMKAIANMMRAYMVSADWLWQDEMAEQFANDYPRQYEVRELDSWRAESEDEITLLKEYRSLNASGKNVALVTLHALANDRTTKKDEPNDKAI